MISDFFPFKKIRRNSKFLLFGAILLIGVVTVYHEVVAVNVWSTATSMIFDVGGSSWWRAMFEKRFREDYQPDSVEDSVAWRSNYTPKTWKPEYKGQANLHAFDDWCGGSTADLFKNMHYPLYPHSRTTVQKLAVSPQWTNYGLRIFGFLHPYTDGEFVFALSSDDNSEFWLSTDDSPLNVQLLAWVGKTGTEWTAPGEFDKYPSQTSTPIRLSAQRKYFFEVIHKQNDRGTDHVEVAWQLLNQDLKFMVIESKYISLYINESALLLSDVAHIPQTAASHQRIPTKQHSATADMLREDPRDTFYQMPLINSKFLQGVLPNCSYKPSYTIKGFPLQRYQGLQFVHMSYVYPNDYTRLTHMETQQSCYYPESPNRMKMVGSSRYMTLDQPDKKQKDSGIQMKKSVLDGEEMFDNEEYQREAETRLDQIDNALFPNYGDDYDDFAQRLKRKVLSFNMQETNNTWKKIHDTKLQRRQGKDGVLQPQLKSKKPVEPLRTVPSQASKHHLHLQQNQTKEQVKKVEQIKPKRKLRPKKTQKLKLVEAAVRPGQTNKTTIPVDREQLKAKERPEVPSERLNSKQYHIQNHNQIQRLKNSKPQPKESDVPHTVAMQQRFETRDKRVTTSKIDRPLVRQNQRDTDARQHLREKEIEMNMPLQQDRENSIHGAKMITGGKMDEIQADTKGEEDQVWEEDEIHFSDLIRTDIGEDERDSLWEPEEHFDSPGDTAVVFETGAKWSQTFQFSHLELQAQRSDRIDLRCNISGNLLLQSSDSLPVVKAFMDQLNEKHSGQFTLVRVINVVKRIDSVQGSRYLLELELKDVNGQLLRLTHYIYALSSQRSKEFPSQQLKPQLMLCNPVGFRWNPLATVHIIVPVKNQARWVQQLITDMERVFRDTQDTNFNLIITDYSSTDMDVLKALQKSSIPRYQYVKLSGNFERSAGLQVGVDLIKDAHSIVFLCDLHIHFPSSIIDTIRKHCVEGYMAFTPIVMRLNCGATPLEAKGYWEVNGFGLLGIYKSDLDAVGGMNTKEYKDRWGGEDWELLDRIFKAGLEVERIFLRNFFHHFHSHRGMWNQRMSSGHK